MQDVSPQVQLAGEGLPSLMNTLSQCEDMGIDGSDRRKRLVQRSPYPQWRSRARSGRPVMAGTVMPLTTGDSDEWSMGDGDHMVAKVVSSVDFSAQEADAQNDACSIEEASTCRAAQEGQMESEAEVKAEQESVLEGHGNWNAVVGLDSIQLEALQNVSCRGVYWQHPSNVDSACSAVLTLHHGGDVQSDGNCLFSAAIISMGLDGTPLEVRLRVVDRFLEDLHNGALSKGVVDSTIKNLYSPDVNTGWGVHFVQEVKMLAKKSERGVLESAILELMATDMLRVNAAELVYRERCIPVEDAFSWSKYMSLSGAESDEFDIVNLQYTSAGLFNVDENPSGGIAAFGDDMSIQCLANMYGRQIYVMQVHGADAGVEDKNCLFFLPHTPDDLSAIRSPPAFLFMKGTGWCGAGADHYQPVLTFPSRKQDPDLAFIKLRDDL